MSEGTCYFNDQGQPSERSEDEWRVAISTHGARWHVRPAKGMIFTGNWALTNNPRRSTSFWRGLLGAYYRDEYPKTEKRLRAATARCVEWCRRQNEAERAARVALRSRVL